MKQITKPLIVGLVAVGGIVAFIWAFGSVSKNIVDDKNSYTVYCYFDSVIGIVVKSRVTMSGVPVGQIDDITLDPKRPRQAKVIIRLDERFRLFKGVTLPDGTSRGGAIVYKRQASILGDYYLDLFPGTHGEYLKSGDQIPNVVGDSGLANVMKKIEGIGDNVEKFTKSLANVYGGVKGTARLNEITENVRLVSKRVADLTKELQTTVKGINRFVDKGLVAQTESIRRIVINIEKTSANLAKITAENQKAIRETLRNLAQITRDNKRGLNQVVVNLGSITSRVDKLLARNDSRIDNTLKNLNDNLVSLKKTLKNVGDITHKINTKKDSTLGRLVNDDKLIKGVEGTVDEVGNFVKKITRLQTQIGLRTEYNIKQNGVKNYVGLKLQPKEDKYYLIELVTDPRGHTSNTTRVTRTTNPNDPAVFREDITETKDTIKFSLQFAKRWHFLTGRFGLIENSGGFGFDMGFWKDRIQLSVDFFDFTRNTSPRIKARAQFSVWKYIFLTGGVDDIISNKLRDYFVGAGFMVTDDDLKAILTVAPTPKL